ncbi:MAG: sugar transferase [Symbiobacteriia bacterium]
MNLAVYRLAKRSIDLLGAIVGLSLLSPVFLGVAVVIKLTDHGPVFYGHQRIGLKGQPFKLLKFRSMRIDAEEILRADPELWQAYVANDFKLPKGEDPRVTPVGAWLRKTSLDELPQLYNVLTGAMSLVGPRPLVAEEIETWYQDRAGELLSVPPGLTGLWQVSGRSELEYPERADLELAYVRDRSLAGDIGILFRTVDVVLNGRGAH